MTSARSRETGSDAARPTADASRIALESDGAAWSRLELDRAADDLAARIEGLRSPGNRPRVGHVFDLRPEAVVAAHAVIRANAVLAPAHPGWGRAQAERFTTALAPTAMLVSAGRSWPGSWKRASLPLPGFAPVDLLVAAEASSPRTDLPTGTDVVVSTSGSGGAPRLVCHSRDRLRANARAVNARLGASSDDATLASLAWAHIGGLAVIFRTAESGGRLVCGPRRFEATEVRSAIERHAVTDVSLVPVMLERLLDVAESPPPTLCRVLVGGAAAPRGLVERAVKAGWPLALTYGLTEAGSQVATATIEDVVRAVSSGTPGYGVLARPLDGFELRREADGELSVRGPSMLLGTAGGDAVDPSIRYRTGDYVDADGHGGLFVVGRKTNRIVSGGTNVDPEEVEAVLSEHPRVRETCVVGVPDERWGELLTAVVVLTDGVGEPGLADELEAFARERLDSPRVPRRWHFVRALPQTATGKIDRPAVRQMEERRAC